MENTGKSTQITLAKNSKYWALHPTTGLCTRLLGLHPTTGLCTRLLGFAPDYRAFHPTNRLCTRLLGILGGSWDLPGRASDLPNQYQNDRNLEKKTYQLLNFDQTIWKNELLNFKQIPKNIRDYTPVVT